MNPEQNNQNNTTPPNNNVPPQNGMPNPTQQHMLLGVLSYLGPLVVVSYIMGKDIPVVKFHVKQGLVLLTMEIVLWALGMILGSMMYQWSMLFSIFHLALLVLSIVGVVNVVQGKQKELPLVGQFANRFTF